MSHFPEALVPSLTKYMFGSNSRSRAERAVRLLGWKATQPSLWEVLDEDVEQGLQEGNWNKKFPQGPKQ